MNTNTNGQIALARKILGLTQGELAKELGWTTHNQILSIEKNRVKPSTQTILAVECLLRRKNLFIKFELELNKYP